MTLPELCVGYPNPSSVSSAIEQAKSDDLTKAKLRAKNHFLLLYLGKATVI